MQALSCLLCCSLILSLSMNSATHAESMVFKRVDSNNASAAIRWVYLDMVDYTLFYDIDSDSDNTLAIKSSSASPISGYGTAVIQTGSEAANMAATNATTYSPNITTSAFFEIESSDAAHVEAAGNSVVETEYQLQPPINTGIDTVVATAVLQVSQIGGGNGFLGSYLKTHASALGVYVTLEYGAGGLDEGSITISSTDSENPFFWADEIDVAAAHTIIVEKVVDPGATVGMESFSHATQIIMPPLNDGPKQASGESSASCALSALGHDSSVTPPPFSGLRVFVQEIVEDEEEQEPAVQIYPVPNPE